MQNTNTKKRTIEVVVQAEPDGASMLFDAEGSVHIADTPEALGRWAVALAQDENTPEVDFGKPSGRWTEFASRVMGELGGKSIAPEEEATAVHLIVQFAMSDDDAAQVRAVVSPSRGRPRSALSVVALGTLLDEFARDESQPNVPAGAPPDAAMGLAEQAAACFLG